MSMVVITNIKEIVISLHIAVGSWVQHDTHNATLMDCRLRSKRCDLLHQSRHTFNIKFQLDLLTSAFKRFVCSGLYNDAFADWSIRIKSSSGLLRCMNPVCQRQVDRWAIDSFEWTRGRQKCYNWGSESYSTILRSSSRFSDLNYSNIPFIWIIGNIQIFYLLL